MLPQQILFQAARSIIPAVEQIASFSSGLEDVTEAYRIVTRAAQQFYGTVITSNIELQAIIRQSATVLAAQSDFFDGAGNEIDEVTKKFDFLSNRLQTIQREIELETRDIVGATDETTNKVLEQVISNFGKLRGQSKKFADELDGVTPLVVNLTSALKTFSIPDFQIPQEIRSLLEGDVNNPDSRLAQQLSSLGLSKEAVNQAKAAGTYYDVLLEKTKTFADFNVVGAKTIENSFSVIKDTLSQFAREIGADPTLGLQNGLAKIIEIISDSGFTENLSKFAAALGGPIGEAIEASFLRASEAFKSLSGDFNNGNIEEKGEAIGKIIGDIIGLTIDAGAAIGVVVAKIANFGAQLAQTLQIVTDILTLNYFQEEVVVVAKGDTEQAEKAFNLLELLVGKDQTFHITDLFINPKILEGINSLLELLRPKKALELKTLNPEEYQKIFDETQRQLDSKGAIKQVVEFVGDRTLPGFLRDVFKVPGRAEATKYSYQVVGQIEEEMQARIKSLEPLILQAPKFAAIDTSSIDNFQVNLAKPLQEEISRLKSNIDFGQLTQGGKDQILKELTEVSSSSELQNVASNISSIVKTSVSGLDTQDFNNKLQVVEQSLQAAIARKNELLEEGKQNDTLEEVAPAIRAIDNQIVKYKESLDQVYTGQDSKVLKQRELIKELESTGQSTTKATKKLAELELVAIEASNISSKALEAPSKGQTIVSSFNEAKDAALAFANTLGDAPEKIATDYEGIISAVDRANKIGAAGAKELQTILLSVSQNDKITIEQRLESLQKLKGLIQEETQTKKALVSVDQKIVELSRQKGEMEAEEASIATNRNDVRQIDLDIQEKTGIILAEKLALEAGLANELVTQRLQNETSFETTKKSLEVSLEKNEISKIEYKSQLESAKVIKEKKELELETLVRQQKVGSLASQKAKAELESLKVSKEILLATQAELILSQKLAKSEEERLKIKTNLDKAVATKKATLEVDFAAGNIDSFAKENSETQDAYNNLLDETSLLETELADKKRVYQESDNASSDFKTKLLNEINNLQLQLINKVGQEASLRKQSAEADSKELKDRADLYAQLATEDVNSKEKIYQAQQKVKQSYQETLDYQQKLNKVIEDSTKSSNNIRIQKIDFDVSLFEQAIKLQEQLVSGNVNKEERKWLTERLNIISNSTKQEIESKQEIVKLTKDASDLTIQESADLLISQTNNRQENLTYNQKIVKSIKEKATLEQSNIELVRKQSLVQAKIDYQISSNQLNLLDIEIQKEKLLLKIKNDQLAVEQKSLIAKQAINGKLTAAEESRLTLVTDEIQVNKLNYEALEESSSSLVTQKQLNTEVYNTTVQKVNEEANHANAINRSNTNLAVQDRRKPKNNQVANPQPEETRENKIKKDYADSIQGNREKNGKFRTITNSENAITLDGVKYSKENENLAEGQELLKKAKLRAQNVTTETTGVLTSWTYVTSKLLANINTKGQTVYGLAGGLTQSQIDLVNNDPVVRKGGRKLTKDGWKQTSVPTTNKQGQSSRYVDQRVTEAQQLIKSSLEFEGYDPRAGTSSTFQELLLQKQKEVFGEDKYYNGEKVDNYKEVNVESNKLFTEERSKLVNADIASSDILIRQFGLNQKSIELQTRLVAEQLKSSYSQDKELITGLQNELKANQTELKSIASYAVLSYRLQNNAKNLQELGQSRQTKTTISEINQIADDLINFYGAESTNNEIIELGQQLEALRQTPDATTAQILEIAEKIKAATELTADNTKPDDLKYSNVLDSLRQGGFFGSDYREAKGIITQKDKELVYSGFNFSNSKVTKEFDKSSELIKDIKILEKDIKEEEKPLATQGVNITPSPSLSPQVTPSPQIIPNPVVPPTYSFGSEKKDNPSSAPVSNPSTEPVYNIYNPRPDGGLNSTNSVKNNQIKNTNNYTYNFPNQQGSTSNFLRVNGF
jgi:hypothetical protein